jgi:hypothetical protein
MQIDNTTLVRGAKDPPVCGALAASRFLARPSLQERFAIDCQRPSLVRIRIRISGRSEGRMI